MLMSCLAKARLPPQLDLPFAISPTLGQGIGMTQKRIRSLEMTEICVMTSHVGHDMSKVTATSQDDSTSYKVTR